MPSLRVRGADLARDVQGRSGPAVVQLHGLTSSRLRETALGLDVARGIVEDPHAARVLSYDARGHGRSTGALDGGDRPEDFTWERLADDLLDMVDLTFGDIPVHGVGPSMGAATLLHAAVREPHRFASLTLVVPPTIWETRAARAAGYEVAAVLVEERGVEAFVAAEVDAPRPPAVADRPRGVPDVPAPLLPTVLRGAALSDLPAPERLAGLDLPTLLLAWRDDVAHPVSSAQALLDLLPRSELVVAASPGGVERWPGLFRDHVITHAGTRAASR